jgi:hypothetical protein
MKKNECKIGIPCNDRFNFFIPLEFEKSESKKTQGKYDNMIVYGLASDNTEDLDGEILEPSGYEFSEFLRKGLVNLEHFTSRKGSSKYWIGEPVDAKVDKNKFFVKAKLWKNSPLARDFWDTVNIMKESGSNRKPGFSIEGTALEKDPSNPKRITKARINNIALTFSPINSNSWIDIVKGQQSQDFINAAFDTEANGGKIYLLDITKEDGTRITIDKEFNIKIRKAMSLGTQSGRQLDRVPTTGASLVAESLDKKLKRLPINLKKSIILLSRMNQESGFSEEKREKIKQKIKEVLK